MRYFIALIFTSICIYASFFEYEYCQDLFTVYAFICIFTSSLMFIAVSVSKDVDLLKDVGKKGFRDILSKLDNVLWIIIWCKVILNGGFWSGAAGVVSSIIYLSVISVCADKRKKLEEGIK